MWSISPARSAFIAASLGEMTFAGAVGAVAGWAKTQPAESTESTVAKKGLDIRTPCEPLRLGAWTGRRNWAVVSQFSTPHHDVAWRGPSGPLSRDSSRLFRHRNVLNPREIQISSPWIRAHQLHLHLVAHIHALLSVNQQA